jgi:hypothetical protein
VPFLVSKAGVHHVYLDKGIGFGFELDNFKSDKEKIKILLGKLLSDPAILVSESQKIIECYKDYFSEKPKTSRIKHIIAQ